MGQKLTKADLRPLRKCRSLTHRLKNTIQRERLKLFERELWSLAQLVIVLTVEPVLLKYHCALVAV